MSTVSCSFRNRNISAGLLVIICVLCLLPYIDKSFHIDDPLFIWIAKHIQSHPFDYYGFTVNWYGFEMPVYEINKNPPLVSYYMALAACFLGWSEPAIHAVFLIPAAVVVVTTYCLAKELCKQPFMAALISICTPVFMLSSTTVMCDMLMLSLWMSSLCLWRHGIRHNNIMMLCTSSLLVSACALTKYFGICLIPLLFVYSITEKRSLGQWIWFLVVPLILVGTYQWATNIMYGKNLILDAGSYALSNRDVSHFAQLASATVTGMAFVGGCCAGILFFAPVLWKISSLIIYFLVILLVVTLSLSSNILNNFPMAGADGINWVTVIQMPFFIAAGVCFLVLTVTDYMQKRDADSLLLFLWSIGTIVFAFYVNWTVNGRSILPLVPVIGILIVRKYDRLKVAPGLIKYVPLVPALVVALLVTHADYTLANSARKAAIEIHETYRNEAGTLWFEGHWGFQYYMQMVGAKPLDYTNPKLKKGDIVIVPATNSNLRPIFKHLALPIKTFQFDTLSFLSTMNGQFGAGFYTDRFGSLPFIFGRNISENYYAYRMIRDKNTKFIF